MKTAHKQNYSDWRDGFLFLGNHLALDFVNTRPAPKGDPVELLTDFPTLLKWFQAAEVIDAADAARLIHLERDPDKAHALATALAFREKLRRALVSLEHNKQTPPDMTKEVNRLMASHPVLHRLENNGKGTWSLEPWFRPERPEDLLAPLAYAAARLFTETDFMRIRKCANCFLHFQDTSRKANRRWCSMRLCGNRFKVAAYAAKHRGETK
jgi:predicted RNA-binding Zn ribbon-like protein